MHQPIVGEVPEYEVGPNEVPWVLGTQLTDRSGPLARAGDGSRVLLIESHGFADRHPYHHQKLTLVFAAMRHFRDRLAAEGYDVRYHEADDFSAGLAEFFDENPDATLVAMRSPSEGSGREFRSLVNEAGGSLRLVENELFCSTPAAVDDWLESESGLRHEEFYRWMRRSTGVLLSDGEPEGGAWNYDDRNREFPPAEWDAPPVPDLSHDERTRETAEWVGERFDTWGNPGKFGWPVTRDQAMEFLNHFLEERLPGFGPYQDAIRSDDWAMAHALLSPALNLGLLHPVEIVRAVEAAYANRSEVELQSAEGCIRQVLGWREFVRHAYRHAMPELATANRLGATRDLPAFYWTADTDMRCLAESVGDVQDRGYAHHIQRLMVLANFATLWGVEPSRLNEWFHATFVDAYHWVTTPNVVEMGQYGHGVFATKPYVASANYVDEMSDYCDSCPYDPDRALGEGACPFNALYWDFLDRNDDDLRSNHRMAPLYGHVDRKREADEMDRIRHRVETLRAATDSL
jgi:deoxyribodipyrimidine photolyase-related protein